VTPDGRRRRRLAAAPSIWRYFRCLNCLLRCRRNHNTAVAFVSSWYERLREEQNTNERDSETDLEAVCFICTYIAARDRPADVVQGLMAGLTGSESAEVREPPEGCAGSYM
jgi:hypothetical protein